MTKRPFIRKQKRKRHGASFWDYEYSEGGHLKLSSNPSEDLEKFMRWLERQKNMEPLTEEACALDLGCGNGRNLIFLAQHFGIRGLGYDNSSAAITQAKTLSDGLAITYEIRSMAGDITFENDLQDFVLDMMSSHFLNRKEREHMRDEVYRVLKPGGWFFVKTFLRDGDLHTKRLIAEHPGKEEGSYIHPVIGVPEHVHYEKELVTFLEEKFIVHKVYKSHQHVSRGKARKRRTVSVYAQKDPYT